MKARAVILTLLFVGMVVTAIGSVSADPGFPPNTPAEDPPANQTLPEVNELAPDPADDGLETAKWHAPPNAPPPPFVPPGPPFL